MAGAVMIDVWLLLLIFFHAASAITLSAPIACTYANSTCSTCSQRPCTQGESFPLLPSACHPDYQSLVINHIEYHPERAPPSFQLSDQQRETGFSVPPELFPPSASLDNIYIISIHFRIKPENHGILLHIEDENSELLLSLANRTIHLTDSQELSLSLSLLGDDWMAVFIEVGGRISLTLDGISNSTLMPKTFIETFSNVTIGENFTGYFQDFIVYIPALPTVSQLPWTAQFLSQCYCQGNLSVDGQCSDGENFSPRFLNTSRIPTDFGADTSRTTVWSSGDSDSPVSYVVGLNTSLNLSKIFVTFSSFSAPPQKVVLQFLSTSDSVWKNLQYFAEDCNTSFGVSPDATLVNATSVNCLEVPMMDSLIFLLRGSEANPRPPIDQNSSYFLASQVRIIMEGCSNYSIESFQICPESCFDFVPSCTTPLPSPTSPTCPQNVLSHPSIVTTEDVTTEETTEVVTTEETTEALIIEETTEALIIEETTEALIIEETTEALIIEETTEAVTTEKTTEAVTTEETTEALTTEETTEALTTEETTEALTTKETTEALTTEETTEALTTEEITEALTTEEITEVITTEETTEALTTEEITEALTTEETTEVITTEETTEALTTEETTEALTTEETTEALTTKETTEALTTEETTEALTTEEITEALTTEETTEVITTEETTEALTTEETTEALTTEEITEALTTEETTEVITTEETTEALTTEETTEALTTEETTEALITEETVTTIEAAATTEITHSMATPSPPPSSSILGPVLGVLAAILVILVLIIALIILLVRRHRRKERSFRPSAAISPPQLFTNYRSNDDKNMELPESVMSNPDGKIENPFSRLSDSSVIIPGRFIQLINTIGHGEFGVVYKGYLIGWREKTTTEVVAIKTLKGLYTPKDIENLMIESEKMMLFNHPNVMNLIGVCTDVGESPYIVMPFMAKGSLLAYLKRERSHLTLPKYAGSEMIENSQRKLLSICFQIAKGMNYLAAEKIVHRDLAARNCMIDDHFVIKVGDFGLSEDIYSCNYFKQEKGDKSSSVKLPVKWMALESLLDGIFTEKTDVWSFGVTCWEVFSLGYRPYPTIHPSALIEFLQSGERLQKPNNPGCTRKVYDLIIQCWNASPEKRPFFEDLVEEIDSLLEGVAGYLEFSAFSSKV